MTIPALLRTIVILLALAWWTTSEVRAAELRIECPKEISPKNLRIVDAPAGWTPFVPSEYEKGLPLSSAGLMYGPPSQLAISKPHDGAPNEDVYPDLRPSKEGNWIACYYEYGQGQDFIQSQRLPDTVTECRITFTKDAQNRHKVDIRCRS